MNSCYDNFLFDFLGSAFGYVVNFFYFIFKNYGVAIIFFTIFTRFIVFPLTIKQQKQMIAQQRLQPKLNELKEKYSNNQQLYQSEMQKLYDKEGVKMSMGCGSMIIQLVLFTGMYMAVRKPLTNVLHLKSAAVSKLLEMFPTSQKNSYYAEVEAFRGIREAVQSGISAVSSASDVVSGSSVASASDIAAGGALNGQLQAILGSEYEAVAQMSQRFRFLGIDLLDVASFKPFNAAMMLAILVFVLQVASMVISNRINKVQSNGAQGCNPNLMAVGMGAFSYWISLSIPAAFPLYWATSSILAPVQTWVTKKYFGALPTNAKAEARRNAMLIEDEKAIKDRIEARKGTKVFELVEPSETEEKGKTNQNGSSGTRSSSKNKNKGSSSDYKGRKK